MERCVFNSTTVCRNSPKSSIESLSKVNASKDSLAMDAHDQVVSPGSRRSRQLRNARIFLGRELTVRQFPMAQCKSRTQATAPGVPMSHGLHAAAAQLQFSHVPSSL
jgi:hypothetical protein